MCRIAGIIAAGADRDENYKKVSIMCKVLSHGGPDDEGIVSIENANLIFGHRRLSIIDLSSKGHQPMADIDQKAWITFNGEIYNYPELKKQLSKIGARFHSDTDTEVILQAYLHWGVAAFSKFRGMFAFALYDSIKAITYLVRDTTGIKPLYYHIENGQLSFASEIKALQIAKIATQINQNWSIKFLAFGNIPEPETTLANVFNLPKGNVLCWNHSTGTHTISCYNSPSIVTQITDVYTAKKTIHDTLKTAIKRQLIADAPIGVFLSGGTDSSLITLLAHREKQQLKTISISFNEKEYDESAYQEQVLNKIQGEKFTHLVQQKDFNSFFPAILKGMDMPTTDGVNTWFISKYAQQDGLKAVLSGVGADELFGGYPSFNRMKYIKYIRKTPHWVLNKINYFTTERYKKMSFLDYDNPLADYLFLRGLFVPADIAQILNCDEKQVNDVLFQTDQFLIQNGTDEEQAAWFETNLYMQNQLLRDTDVMSMNHGLEVRVPFLDEDFQQAANSISSEIRFNKNQPKKLLIDSFKDVLPQAVWNRPKMGFSFPLQQWMRQNNEIVDENFYKNKKTRDIIKKFKNDQLHWSKAFALYQVQLHA